MRYTSMLARVCQLTAVTIPALNPHLSLHFAQETHVCDLRDRDLVGIDAQTRRRLLQVDTYRLNVSHNDFKKVYRAKHVLSKRRRDAKHAKSLSYPLFGKEGQGEIFRIAKSPLVPLCKRGNNPNLASFAPLRESSFFRFCNPTLTEISNIFG